MFSNKKHTMKLWFFKNNDFSTLNIDSITKKLQMELKKIDCTQKIAILAPDFTEKNHLKVLEIVKNSPNFIEEKYYR